MLPDPLDDHEVIGLLARHVPTRLLDISRTGCLLESRHSVDVGTVGELRLKVQRQSYVDDVRVTRCVLTEGSSSTYLVGVEFVATHRPGERSIRRAIAVILRRILVSQSETQRSRKSAAVNPLRFKGEAS
jgi:hypothetical protein